MSSADEAMAEVASIADEIVAEAASTADEVVADVASTADELVAKATSTADEFEIVGDNATLTSRPTTHACSSAVCTIVRPPPAFGTSPPARHDPLLAPSPPAPMTPRT